MGAEVMPEALRAELGAALAASPLLATFGIELLVWGDGGAEVRMMPEPGHANLVGAIHGGVLFALADAAFEAACNGYGRVCVAIETSCHYHAPAMLGQPLRAEAAEVSRSRRVASHRIAVTSGERLVASYLALAHRSDRWHLGLERWPESWRATH